tara:strand:- start:2840 stop:4870 length:2031 start_codon:yes stop_codon:yes gene_type:complete
MADTPGPIYTGAGIPLKGFAPLLEATKNAGVARQKSALAFQKARESQKNRIDNTLSNIYETSGQELAPSLRPFWGEYVDTVAAQVEAMTFIDGTPIETIADGQRLLREANSFYDELEGYNHFEGNYVAEDNIKYLNSLIGDPKKIANLEQNSPIDKIYNFYDEQSANSQLAQMQAYADYGFMGVKAEEFGDGSYINGGYKNYGRIDYTTGAPHMVVTQPNGISDSSTQGGIASGDTYLSGLSIYGPNNAALFSIERFATDRSSMELEAIGQQYLQPIIKDARVGLGWSEEYAKNHIDSVIKDPNKDGQNARYAMLNVYRDQNPGFLNDEQWRGFLYNSPEMAFGKDEDGKLLATPNQVAELQRKYDSVLNNENLRRRIINGSNYDRLIPSDASEDERQQGLSNVLATMTNTNPNDIFALDDVSNLINVGSLLNGANQADAFNGAYARLLAHEHSEIGGNIQPGMTIADIVMVGGPSFAMVGTQPKSDAGVTRKFIENFEQGQSNLPQTIGNFGVNMKGSSEYQFSPQDGVEGGIDNVFFTKDNSGKIKIGVSLNKSGVTGYGVSSSGKKITPLEGEVIFQSGDPFFSVGIAQDGSNFLEDRGRIEPTSSLLNQTYDTGSPDLVFYFDPTSNDDKFRLEQLGSKLDEFFGYRGQSFPNAMNPNFGYTLNAMFTKSIQ